MTIMITVSICMTIHCYPKFHNRHSPSSELHFLTNRLCQFTRRPIIMWGGPNKLLLFPVYLHDLCSTVAYNIYLLLLFLQPYMSAVFYLSRKDQLFVEPSNLSQQRGGSYPVEARAVFVFIMDQYQFLPAATLPGVQTH